MWMQTIEISFVEHRKSPTFQITTICCRQNKIGKTGGNKNKEKYDSTKITEMTS